MKHKKHGKDSHAHATHHHMNSKHGTPGAFEGGEEYTAKHTQHSHGSHNSESFTAGKASGSEGQGVPGSMESNYECC